MAGSLRGCVALLAVAGLAACGQSSHAAVAPSPAAATGTGRPVLHEFRFRQVLATAKGSAQAPVSGPVATAAVPSGAGCATVNTTDWSGCDTAAVRAEIARLGDCSHPVPLIEPSLADEPDQPIAACDRDGAVYVLAPAYMGGGEIKDASSVDDATQGWIVQLDFDGKGSEDFGKLTTAITSLTQPLNQVAMVLDGVVQSAPMIESAITGGQATVNGGNDGFSQADTDRLATVLNQAAADAR